MLAWPPEIDLRTHEMVSGRPRRPTRRTIAVAATEVGAAFVAEACQVAATLCVDALLYALQRGDSSGFEWHDTEPRRGDGYGKN